MGNVQKGAELLVKSAVASGVEVCFSNPGTTELPLVAALDAVPGIRAYLGLFEGVCTGAADGYGRMLGKPAMTLLHLGPGLANGISNLHNARRAGTPIFNVIGEHATWHLPSDPPLAMDVESLAKSVSGWYRTSSSAEGLGRDATDAVSATLKGQIATLIVPQDHQWSECADSVITRRKPEALDEKPVPLERALGLLRSGVGAVIILGGMGLQKEGLLHAARIKTTTGCDLMAEPFPAHMHRGAGLPDLRRLPYFPETAIRVLADYQAVILAGTRKPVAFFGYKGMSSSLINGDKECLDLGGERGIIMTLKDLADALGAPDSPEAGILAQLERPVSPDGPLTVAHIGAVLASLQPEGAIVVDESNTSGAQYFKLSGNAPQFSLLTLTGGSLGLGPPCAVGAAVACPDRQVINLQADGSAMYTFQALWTQAREGLNVTTLICANHGYNILKVELARAGVPVEGGNTARLVDLSGIDWVGIGRGLGVPSESVRTVRELTVSLKKALSEHGPHLIEMLI
jgi:acetolactate synthase-1/2/3 large subunit